MCGTCAGNPGEVALGDVVIANTVFQYDEGKRTTLGFQGDIFTLPMSMQWLQRAKGLRPEGLPSHGPASERDAIIWLLERLTLGDDPASHPARNRYFPDHTWEERIRSVERDGLLRRRGRTFVITKLGKEFLDHHLAYNINPPKQLPFKIVVGPMASGNAVAKDGVTWDMLKSVGQRSAVAVEMEAAGIGIASYSHGLSNWIVAKGVMDHADPNKNDRYQAFAARASAEVLLLFLEGVICEESQNAALLTIEQDAPATKEVVDQTSHDSAWLQARFDLDEIVRDHYCANIVAAEGTEWRSLIDDFCCTRNCPQSKVDLHDPATRRRRGFVQAIIDNFGIGGAVVSPPDDLILLSQCIKKMLDPIIIIQHFDFIREWSLRDQRQVLSAFAFFVEQKRVSIILHSREGFHALIPREHWVSPFRPEEIRLWHSGDSRR
jgi:nucleoside phosphorylase